MATDLPRREPGTTGARGRFVSVGTKLASATIALMVLVTAAVHFKLSNYQREGLLQSKESAASAVAQLFSESCTAPVVFGDDASIKETLAALGRNDQVEYAAVWAVEHGNPTGQPMAELARGAPEPLRVVPEHLQLQRFPERVVVTSPIRKPTGAVVGASVIAFSLARENAAIATVERQTLLLSAGVALGLTMLLVAIARVGIVRPLGKLVRAAKNLESGGAAVDVDVRANDEIGQLATGFRTMAVAINQREERIKARNSDMRLVLDNVGQGFITLDVDGKIAGDRSRVVEEWFGAPLEQMTFASYLATVDDNVGQWFALGWEALKEDVMPLELCLDQLPQSLRKAERSFELAYRPIMKHGRLDKVIVVITDVTARVEGERAERVQRETVSLFHRILADRPAFEDFFNEASALVEAIVRSDARDLRLLKRQIHTLKGNCGLFGIESVATLCHDLETRIEQSADLFGERERAELLRSWDTVVQTHAQLAPSGQGLIQLEADEYDRFLAALKKGAEPQALFDMAYGWRFEPASRRLALVCEQLDHLAARLGKEHVKATAEPTSLRLPSSKWAPFWSSFAHVIRNTVDHGVETQEERVARGKPAHALVSIAIERAAPHVVVTIRDDGAGIDWKKIEARAEQLGLPHSSPEELAEALFADGVSTQDEVSGTSGRGVGLGAVRAAIHDLGGAVQVVSEAGRGTTMRFILPDTMLLDDGPARGLTESSSARASAARLAADPLSAA